MTFEKEYRVKIGVRNNLILRKIEGLGCKSVSEFCRVYNLSATLVNSIIAMTLSPLTSSGFPRRIVQELLDIFNCGLDDLFTENQINTKLEHSTRQVEVSETEAAYYLQSQSYNIVENMLEHESQEIIDKQIFGHLGSLSPREQLVIKARFGLDGNPEQTLAEIAKEQRLSMERIRGIEARALRKLRWRFCRESGLVHHPWGRFTTSY
jgi:RNA polymerase sigma factor (sigma-70 family)